MSDERLSRDLRSVDAPASPRPEFVEGLYARLVDEQAGTGPAGVRRRGVGGRRGPRMSGRLGVIAAAALVGGALIGGALVGGGASPRPETARASPDAAAPAVSPSDGPSADPATPTRAATPEPSYLAVSDRPASLDTLASDGRIVFERRSITEPTRLLVYGADGSTSELAPGVPGMQISAAWAPDGTQVAFAAVPVDSPMSWRIWRSTADGSPAKLVSTDCDLPDCLAEAEPAFAADGTRLVFVRTKPGPDGEADRSVIAIRDLTTGEVTELASTARPDTEMLLHPTISPDGSSIAFAVAPRGVTFEEAASAIWVVGTDDAGLRQVTPDELVAGDPAWSPDGRRILFGSYPIRTIWAENQRDRDISHLYTMAPDGSDIRRLPIQEQVGGASWTSGGAQILFTAIVNAGDLSPGFTAFMVVDADARELRWVTQVSAACCSWYAVQQPTP
jgi:hypothetical protein